MRARTYPVYASRLLFANEPEPFPEHRSARGATLGNGGWLAVTMPELPPDRMHRPLRGVLTYLAVISCVFLLQIRLRNTLLFP
ncbi:MAG: hypothetical protein KJP15_11810 [Gammaproteobacteria bacterium]|nr:hypothetical protein [Gammaproteobacteria bacterium]